jgi:hypothetical protein
VSHFTHDFPFRPLIYYCFRLSLFRSALKGLKYKKNAVLPIFIIIIRYVFTAVYQRESIQVHQVKPDSDSTERSQLNVLGTKIVGSDYSDPFLQWKYEPNFEIGNTVGYISKYLLITV